VSSCPKPGPLLDQRKAENGGKYEFQIDSNAPGYYAVYCANGFQTSEVPTNDNSGMADVRPNPVRLIPNFPPKSDQTSPTFDSIAAGQSGTNTTPFQIQIPASLRCGSVATLQLQLDTNAGRFTLPIRVQVGRPAQAGAPLTTIFFEDVDNARAKWKKKGGFEAFQGPAKSGTMSFHTEDPGKDDNDNRLSLLFTKKQITIPQNAGQVRLSFFHIFNFEPGYDGGVLEISSDGGDTWQDAGSLMLAGGYDGHVTTASNNPLGDAFAWTARGKAGVFSQVVVDLSSFAGSQIKLRFKGGFDNASGIKEGFTGWFIDDIQITAVLYSCGTT